MSYFRAPRETCSWVVAWVAAAVLAGWSAGCSDPYSQRRINRRLTHLQETTQWFGDHARRGAHRNQEAMQRIEEWWQDDVAEFNRKAPTIGDYIW